MKIKDIPETEKLNNLKVNVWDLSSKDKTLPPKHFNKNCYEEQIDLLFYENQ